MTGKTVQNDFQQRLDVLRHERAVIAADIARLQAKDEALIRQEERLNFENQSDEGPFCVKTAFLLEKLDMSERTFRRLRANAAKGFPQPVSGIDGDPRWNWNAVRAWLEV